MTLLATASATPSISRGDRLPLTVGVPTEIKTAEGRVAITPDGVRELTSRGIQVVVQSGAGAASSLSDAEYATAGARLVPTAADAWSQDMVVKVKEPQPSEFGFLRPNLTLFTYLHLAAYPSVAEALLSSRCTAIAKPSKAQIKHSRCLRR
jgi:alanine dehydrogenase